MCKLQIKQKNVDARNIRQRTDVTRLQDDNVRLVVANVLEEQIATAKE